MEVTHGQADYRNSTSVLGSAMSRPRMDVWQQQLRDFDAAQPQPPTVQPPATVPPSPPPSRTTASATKKAARQTPLQWLINAIDRFPEKEGEGREEYFRQLERKMRNDKALKGRTWKAVYIGRKVYELDLLPRRQQRQKPD